MNGRHEPAEPETSMRHVQPLAEDLDRGTAFDDLKAPWKLRLLMPTRTRVTRLARAAGVTMVRALALRSPSHLCPDLDAQTCPSGCPSTARNRALHAGCNGQRTPLDLPK